MAPTYRNPFVVYSAEANIHIFGQPGETQIYWADVEFLTSRPYAVEDLEEMGQTAVGVDDGVFTYWPTPPPPVIVSYTYREGFEPVAMDVYGTLLLVLKTYTYREGFEPAAVDVYGTFQPLLAEYTVLPEGFEPVATDVYGTFDLVAVKISWEEGFEPASVDVYGELTLV
jgi:hypothetical protein